MQPIRIGIIGVGNCASSLIQGIHYYKNKTFDDSSGILFWDIGGYKPSDIIISSAFDIDERKVGFDVHQAIFKPPNCTKKIAEELPESDVIVSMGKVLDGIADHMENYSTENTFLLSSKQEPSKEDVIDILKKSKTEILLNYLPVGSEKASEFYAECSLEAGTAFINNIPVFIASNPEWSEKFKSAGIPILGDDIKSQIGATIIHRTLTRLFADRGVTIENTYQLNTGGNTDFLNMLDRDRLKSKKKSKTEAVQSVLNKKMDEKNIHIGPSDYVPWLSDNKLAFIRLEGKIFGDVPMNLELRLSVEDSPNSAGAAIDCIRFCKMNIENNLKGLLEAACAYYFKRPPVQYSDNEAFSIIKKFADNI